LFLQIAEAPHQAIVIGKGQTGGLSFEPRHLNLNRVMGMPQIRLNVRLITLVVSPYTVQTLSRNHAAPPRNPRGKISAPAATSDRGCHVAINRRE
jgi:hypothetical protein